MYIQYAQELLSTFSLSIAEVALQPSTGGTFVVAVTHRLPPRSREQLLQLQPQQRQEERKQEEEGEGEGGEEKEEEEEEDEEKGRQQTQQQTYTTILWDRSRDGGFPETKELKRRLRDVVDPDRHLGHVDRHPRAAQQTDESGPATACGDQDCPP
ncbi:hypothetical protein XA68_11589 [Ophiocordyceps unilateralis]|uniref:Uncharacterized protein n=1 Tax=Ophiocordyceps unilateralis TaxID=268505 RepID=A0A2A9PGP0_OPHUN|nr:hypothetical protein XA68_11589 [Ophiocordyceps unilateralis]